MKTAKRYHFTPIKMAIIKEKEKEVLERMQRYWNTYTPLVGMSNGVGAVGNSMMFSQKIKHNITV